MTREQLRLDRFAQYCWFVVAYTVAVIVWGAFVRATGSGAGCGSHWPTCNGEVIPHSPRLETLIEFGHRGSSGLLGILAVILVVWAFRRFPPRDPGRRSAGAVLVFVLAEAIIGAGIVKFDLVTANDSLARVLTVGFHLVNTFLLLAVAALTAWRASQGPPFLFRKLRLSDWRWLAAAGGFLVLGGTGAVTALGDTLWSQAGLTPADSPMVATLVSLRLVHPLMGLMWIPLVASTASRAFAINAHAATRPLAAAVALGYGAQLLMGLLNAYLLAPIWMQMLHLMVAASLWIALVLLGAASMADEAGRARTSEAAEQSLQGAALGDGETVR